MKKNAFVTSSIFFSLATPALIFAAEELPKQPLFARYDAMMNRSPFAIATAVVAPPSAPNFAKDLYIANTARLPDESIVTLTSGTDKNMKEYLSTTGTNPHGYSISNIEWSDKVGATKVTISKDGQFATLTFNQALVAQPVAGMNPQPQQPAIPQPAIPQPGAAPQAAAAVPAYGAANQLKPAPVPMLPTPPPRVRGVIQRNPAPTKEAPAQSAAAAQDEKVDQ